MKHKQNNTFYKIVLILILVFTVFIHIFSSIQIFKSDGNIYIKSFAFVIVSFMCGILYIIDLIVLIALLNNSSIFEYDLGNAKDREFAIKHITRNIDKIKRKDRIVYFMIRDCLYPYKYFDETHDKNIYEYDFVCLSSDHHVKVIYSEENKNLNKIEYR